jgi:hypothetical protein
MMVKKDVRDLHRRDEFPEHTLIALRIIFKFALEAPAVGRSFAEPDLADEFHFGARRKPVLDEIEGT